MPIIQQYNAPSGALRPNEAGEQALDLEARMSGRLGEERAALIRSGGENVDRGLTEAGRGLDTLGNVVERHQAQTEIVSGVAGLSTTLDNLVQHYDQAAKTADPFDPNFSSDWRENVMQPALQNFVSQFNTPAGKEWAVTHAAQIGTELYRHTTAADMNRAQDHATLAMNQTLNSLSNVVRDHPEMTDTAVGMLPGTIAQLAANANLSPEAAEKMKTDLFQQEQKIIVATGIKSLMETNLPAGIKMANDPKYNQILSGDDKDTLIKHGEQYQKATELQSRMIDADNRRQEREASQQTMSQIVASTVGPNGQTVLPQNFATNVAKAATMPGASPQLATSMLKWGHSMALDASAGKNDVTNDAIGNNFNTRAYLPPDDPHALTYKEVFDAKADHQLSNADFGRFNQAIARNQKSDMNQQLEGQLVHNGLTQAAHMLGFDPTMGGTSSSPAEQSYNRLLQWFTPSYEAALRKGIAPSEAVEKLLTPERIASFKVNPQANAGSGVAPSGIFSRGFWHSTPATPLPAQPAAQNPKTSHDLSVIFGGH